MGVAYFVDSEPIFLTFKNYNLVLRTMENMGIKSTDIDYSAEFDEESNERIISFLSNNKELIDNGKFEIEGEEAKEEISTLLDAYRWAYGGFDFYRLSNPFGKFVPFAYAGIDVRYPYGKQFYISKVNKKRLFSKRLEPQIHILIDIEKVTHIKGDLSSFEITFSENRRMIFFENQFCIL